MFLGGGCYSCCNFILHGETAEPIVIQYVPVGTVLVFSRFAMFRPMIDKSQMRWLQALTAADAKPLA